MRDAAPFTLSDLIGVENLGLELRTGHNSCEDRLVCGAHCIEIAAPIKWLERNWVMLTTGVRLQDQPAEQRQLVRELAGHGISGLGIAEDLVFQTIPSAVLDEAEDCDLPVFAVPLRTPFREIVKVVNQSVLSADVRGMRRFNSIQRFLIDGLGAESPGAEVVERLATVLDATVVVIGEEAAVWPSNASLPIEPLINELNHAPLAAHSFQVERWYVSAVPVDGPDGDLQWLACGSRTAASGNPQTKSVMQIAVPLMKAAARLERGATEQTAAVRTALLDDLLAEHAAADLHSLECRAELLGFSLNERTLVAVVIADGSVPIGDEVVNAMRGRFERLGPPSLIRADPRRLTLVTQATTTYACEQLEAAIDGASNSDPLCWAGIGRPVSSLAELRDSHLDATMAAGLARKRGGLTVLGVEDLDIGSLLISEVPTARIQPKIAEVLAPLKHNQNLLDTIRVYFENEFDVACTAQALHLHPNSLRYRLGRLEKLLGRRLKKPETITDLYLALSAEPVTESGHEGEDSSPP